jgi:energy-coupling factor transporter ATP-binding protein EcfA2
LLEKHPDLPVIPAALSGPERALPRGAALPLPVWNRVLLGPARRLSGPPRELAYSLHSEVAELVAAERARRQTRYTPRRAARVLAVLGIDGSGKSTLAQHLALELSAGGSTSLVGDELQLFAGGEARPLQPLPAERLRRRLSRRAKSAHSLGGYKLPKLAELLLREELARESRRWYDPDWVLQDGSPLLNLAGWLALYREGEFDADFAAAALLQLVGRGSPAARRRYRELGRLRALVPFHLELPAAAVFIALPPETAVARIAARGEARQVHETVEKLALLQRSYTAVCAAAEAQLGLAVLRLDATRPIDVLTDEAARFARALGEGKHG